MLADFAIFPAPKSSYTIDDQMLGDLIFIPKSINFPDLYLNKRAKKRAIFHQIRPKTPLTLSQEVSFEAQNMKTDFTCTPRVCAGKIENVISSDDDMPTMSCRP